MIDPASLFKTRPDARYRNIGGEGIVVRQAAGEVLVLNEVGVRVLDLVASGKTAGDIVSALAAEYDVDLPTLERDVPGYIQELVDAGILERSPAA
jgi:hypothetical protein